MKQKKPRRNFVWAFNFVGFFASWCPEATEERSLLRGLRTKMNMPLPYCVYILFSEKDHLLYIGFSANLEKRIETHNSGGCNSTSSRRPVKLIFCEFYLFEEDARKREMYFKTTMGKKAIKLMLSGTLIKMGYKNPGGPKVEIIYEDLESLD